LDCGGVGGGGGGSDRGVVGFCPCSAPQKGQVSRDKGMSLPQLTHDFENRVGDSADTINIPLLLMLKAILT
jgi:hypothetical protein